MIHDTDFDPPGSTLSVKKLEANRANARKSTGPKTEAGKEKSRRNAWKHGMCALVVAIPDEDPTPYIERNRKWQEELNPHGADYAGYLVELAVRNSSRLDRCAVVHDARIAELARDADRVEAEGRMVRVDELIRMIATDPDVAVRRLRQVPEGCDALIHEWDLLRVTLIDPWHWDAADEARASRLLGSYSNVADKTPSILRLPTLAIVEHREVAAKLKLNEHPDWITWKQRYDHPGQHQHDLDRVDALHEKAARARDYILAHLEAQVADLGRRRDDLVEDQAESRSEATIRARFDTSDAGKLIRRYEADAERSLLKLAAEAIKLSPRAAEASDGEKVAEEEAPVRNEPTAQGALGPKAGLKGSPEGGHSSPERPKVRRRDVRNQR